MLVKSSEFREGGVRKLVILAVVPKIQELHENLDFILRKLGISSLEFSYSSDIKMCKLMDKIK